MVAGLSSSLNGSPLHLPLCNRRPFELAQDTVVTSPRCESTVAENMTIARWERASAREIEKLFPCKA
jgi:hypothetical protein